MASIMEMEDNSGMMKVYLPTFKENTQEMVKFSDSMQFCLQVLLLYSA